MSEEKNLPTVSGIDKKALVQVNEIIRDYALPALVQSGNSIQRDLVVAEGISRLEAAIPDAWVKRLRSLEGHIVGYLTDRDRPDRDGRMRPRYDDATIRRCWIEAAMMGLRFTGNEVNIIDGKVYATKAGVIGLVKRFPGVTDVMPEVSIKSFDPQAGKAMVAFKVTWKFHGKTERLEGEIPIKVHSTSSVDLVIGKGTKKVFSRVYEYLSGSNHIIPEGDILEMEPLPTAPSPIVPSADGKIAFGRKAEQIKEAEIVQEQQPSAPQPHPADPTAPQPHPADPTAPQPHPADPTAPQPHPADPKLPESPVEEEGELPEEAFVEFTRGPYAGKSPWDVSATPEGIKYLEYLRTRKPEKAALITAVIESRRRMASAMS